MFELSIGIPQVVMLVICLINVVMSAIHHGEEQGPYSVWTTPDDRDCLCNVYACQQCGRITVLDAEKVVSNS